MSKTLEHHGGKGMKWGVKNGPPYPIKRNTIVQDAIDSGQVSKTINREKQMRHTKSHHVSKTGGISYVIKKILRKKSSDFI